MSMSIICFVLGICLIIALICILRYKRQIYKLAIQIKFHRENSSNIAISLDMHSKEFEELSEQLELYNKKARSNLLQLEIHEEEMKAQITDISHDIRTPLTSISGYVQMLRLTQDEDKREKYLDIIEERLKTLSTMLDDFFIYSKINSGKKQGNKDAVDLRKMLSKVLLDYYGAFEDKGIDVKIELEEGNSIIYALEEDIERILLNLIKNVLVHGDKTCYIALRCQWKNVEINIFNETDENLPQNPDKVFDRYFRGDVARSSQESTGLGLAITKGLVENNDGKIECQIKDKLFGMILSFATMD